MDEVPGESLRQRLNREGPLAPDEVQGIVADIAASLALARRVLTARPGGTHDLSSEHTGPDSAGPHPPGGCRP